MFLFENDCYRRGSDEDESEWPGIDRRNRRRGVGCRPCGSGGPRRHADAQLGRVLAGLRRRLRAFVGWPTRQQCLRNLCERFRRSVLRRVWRACRDERKCVQPHDGCRDSGRSCFRWEEFYSCNSLSDWFWNGRRGQCVCLGESAIRNCRSIPIRRLWIQSFRRSCRHRWRQCLDLHGRRRRQWFGFRERFLNGVFRTFARDRRFGLPSGSSGVRWQWRSNRHRDCRPLQPGHERRLGWQHQHAL